MWEHFLKKTPVSPFHPRVFLQKEHHPSNKSWCPLPSPSRESLPPPSPSSRHPLAIHPPPSIRGRPSPLTHRRLLRASARTPSLPPPSPLVAKAHTNATAGGPRRWPRHTQMQRRVAHDGGQGTHRLVLMDVAATVTVAVPNGRLSLPLLQQ
jgi:hypothetical protein